jgi:hypothetical protein
VVWRRVGLADRIALLSLLAETALLLGLLRHGFTRPFWYDEQQRAYQLALPPRELLRGLPDAESPLPLAWIAVEKAFAVVFGQVEWALRLPVIASVVLLALAGYALARRMVGVAPSALIVGALLANGSLAIFAPQIKQYPTEMALAVVVLLLWLQAGDPGRSGAGVVVRYLGILGCLLAATATVFVAAPLLAFDLVRAARERHLGRRALLALATGAAGLVHLVLFVLPQSKVAGADSYWEGTFLPVSSLGAAARFVVRQSLSFVPGIVTQPFGITSSWQRAAISVLLVVALLAGVAVAVVDRRVRPLLLALGGALLLQLVASAGRRWSFGFVRINVFLLPLLYLLAGVGLARGLALLARLSLRPAPAQPGPTEPGAAGPAPAGPALAGPPRARRALALAGLAALAAVALVGGSAGAAASAAQFRQAAVASSQPGWYAEQTGWGDGLRAFVERTRLEAGPDDVVVVVRRMGFKGWAYYMWSYDGWPPRLRGTRPVDARRTLMMNAVDQGRLRTFLAEHGRADRVFVLLMASAYRGSAAAVEGPLRQLGRRPVERTAIPWTGTLTVWAATPRSSPRP